MFYTASSVMKELTKATTLTINGDLKCPQSTSWTHNGNTPCEGSPISCSHNSSQTCKQMLHVFDSKGIVKLAVLVFYYPVIHGGQPEGVIDSKDTLLEKLIKIHSIDKKKFIAV